MPFTPLHMGPGMLFKSLLHGCFSLMVFGWAQILMDIQPLVVMITGQGHLHGFSHTYIGASLIAVFAVVSGKRLSEFGLVVLGVSDKNNPIKISWVIGTVSAFIGTFSHVFLDSIMHGDLEPFVPFSSTNDLLGLISIDSLTDFCIYSGLIGGVVYLLINKLKAADKTKKRTNHKNGS